MLLRRMWAPVSLRMEVALYLSTAVIEAIGRVEDLGMWGVLQTGQPIVIDTIGPGSQVAQIEL